jgi:hypothetical protein
MYAVQTRRFTQWKIVIGIKVEHSRADSKTRADSSRIARGSRTRVSSKAARDSRDKAIRSSAVSPVRAEVSRTRVKRKM